MRSVSAACSVSPCGGPPAGGPAASTKLATLPWRLIALALPQCDIVRK